MAPASVQVVCMEPVVFLRGQSAVGEDARGRRRQIDFDAPPSQLRGLVTLSLPRASRIKEVTVTLQGKARTDWPEGIGPNRLDTVDESIIFRQKVVLYSARESAPTSRPRASSIGPGINWAKDDLAWPSPGSASGSREAAGSPSVAENRKASKAATGAEASKSPKISRSISKTAAKAGAAILPPTIMRDLQGNGSSSNGNNNRPHLSPTLHRPSSGGSYSAPRSPLSALAASSASSLALPSRESYFDPPPQYGNTDGSPTDPTMSSSAPHPQSVSAAGPMQRSILHSTSTAQRQTSAQRSARGTSGDSPTGTGIATVGTTGHGVRFDPQAVNTAFEREGVSPSSNAVAPNLAANRSNGVGPAADHAVLRSEPSSRRVSIEQNALQNLSLKGKGKATGHSSSPTSTPSVPTEKGARRGIKNLLGTLLKDDDGDRKSSRSSTGDFSYSQEGAAASSSNSLHSNNGGEEQWHEFPKGTHTYPFSIPLPSNLPPTLHADFGSNAYMLKAYVHRAGPLTANLSSEAEVTLVHAPNEDGQDDIDTIVVERNWEDALRYMVMVMGKAFPVGGRIPIWTKFVPMEKVRIHRILASLEERTAYYAKGRKVARHEVPRRWTLLKVLPAAGAGKAALQRGILPILSDDPDAIIRSPLAPMARSAALSYSDAAAFDSEHRGVIEQAALASLGDPTGPWELAMELEVPKTSSTRINISSNHNKSNIAVVHVVKLAIRVERLDSYKGADPSTLPDSERQLFDILIEAPVAINHSHTANAWLTLPDYWSVPALDAAEAGENVVSSSAAGGGVAGKTVVPSLASIGKGKSVATSAQPAVNASQNAARLARLGRQWLSLTASGRNEEGGVQRTQQAGAARTAGFNPAPFTPQSAGQATVTYAGNYGEQEEHTDDHGLPTYAMIDSASGSVDLPPNDPRRRVVKSRTEPH